MSKRTYLQISRYLKAALWKPAQMDGITVYQLKSQVCSATKAMYLGLKNHSKRVVFDYNSGNFHEMGMLDSS